MFWEISADYRDSPILFEWKALQQSCTDKILHDYSLVMSYISYFTYYVSSVEHNVVRMGSMCRYLSLIAQKGAQMMLLLQNRSAEAPALPQGWLGDSWALLAAAAVQFRR